MIYKEWLTSEDAVADECSVIAAEEVLSCGISGRRVSCGVNQGVEVVMVSA